MDAPNETQTQQRNEYPAALPPEVEAALQQRAEERDLESSNSDSPQAPAHPTWGTHLKQWGPVGIFLIYLLGKLKIVSSILLPALKVLQIAKVLTFAKAFLTTGGTMLLSVLVYAQIWEWRFALGFVICILIHEMGHVFMAWRVGVPVSAPIFIPMMGALIAQKRAARSAWDEALIGIGGPLAGTLAGIICYLIYTYTGSGLMLALAYTGFLINLFNLAPIYPLDGGWIVGAVSPRLWLIGIIVLGILLLSGWVLNPLLLILILLALPRIWYGFKTGRMVSNEMADTSPRQKLEMGLAYIGLCAFLGWLMLISHVQY